MFVRVVSLVVLFGILGMVGCSSEGVLSSSEESGADLVDGSGNPAPLRCAEPKEEAKSWSELKRQYAGREPKDN